MFKNVVAVHLPEDAPKFKARIEGLVTRPNTSLHRFILRRVAVVVGAFNFVGMPHVPVVRLHPLAGLEAVGEFIQKNLDVVPLTRGVRSADPHQIPREDVDPELVA